jgi:hypothetical protein
MKLRICKSKQFKLGFYSGVIDNEFHLGYIHIRTIKKIWSKQ